MKFGQLIEYNMKNIILEKWYTKFRGEASQNQAIKKSKLSISLDQHINLLLYVQLQVYQNK